MKIEKKPVIELFLKKKVKNSVAAPSVIIQDVTDLIYDNFLRLRE